MIYSWWYGSTLASILTSITKFITDAGYTSIFGFVFALGLIFSVLSYLVNAGKYIDYFALAKVYIVSFIIYGVAITSTESYTIDDICTQTSTSVSAPFIIGFPLEIVTSIEEYLRNQLSQYLPLPADMQANDACFTGYQLLRPAVVYNAIEPYTQESMIEYIKDCVFPSIQAGDINMDALYNANPNNSVWSNMACNSGMLCASLDTYYYSGSSSFYSQPGHPNGELVSCPNAYSYISADLANQLVNQNTKYNLGYVAVATQALGTANLSNTVNNIPNWIQDETAVLMGNTYTAQNLLTQAVAIQELANASAQFGEGLAYSETYLSNLAKIEALSFGAGGSLESTKGLLEIFFAGSAPIFILLWLTPLGRASFLAFLQMLIWIPTWSVASEVVAAILELNVGGNNKFDLSIAQISNMTTIFNKAAQQAIFLNHLVPLLTFTLATGSVYAITKVASAAGEMMMAGARQGAELMTTGNLSAGNQQLDTFNALNSSIGNMQYDMYSMYGSSIGNTSVSNLQAGNIQKNNVSTGNRGQNVFTNTPIMTNGQEIPVTGTYTETAPGVYNATGPVQLETKNGPITINPYDGSAEFSISKNGDLNVKQGIVTMPTQTSDGKGMVQLYYSDGKLVKGEEELSDGKMLSETTNVGQTPLINLFGSELPNMQTVKGEYQSPEAKEIKTSGNVADTVIGLADTKTMNLFIPANTGQTWYLKNEEDISKIMRQAQVQEHDKGYETKSGHRVDNKTETGIANETVVSQGSQNTASDSTQKARESYRNLEAALFGIGEMYFDGNVSAGLSLLGTGGRIKAGIKGTAGAKAQYTDGVTNSKTQTHQNTHQQSSSVNSSSSSYANTSHSYDAYQEAAQYAKSVVKNLQAIEDNKAIKQTIAQNPTAVVDYAIDALVRQKVLRDASMHHMTEAEKLIDFQKTAQEYLQRYNELPNLSNVKDINQRAKILKTDAAILDYIAKNYDELAKQLKNLKDNPKKED